MYQGGTTDAYEIGRPMLGTDHDGHLDVTDAENAHEVKEVAV